MTSHAKRLAILVGITVGVCVYGFSLVSALPLPWYLPMERRWVFGVSAPGLGMDWYGRTAWSVVAAVGGAGLAALGGRWLADGTTRRMAGVVGGWALSAVWIVAALIIYQLSTRVVLPR